MRALSFVCTLLLASVWCSAAVKVEKTSYRGWSHCYRLSNGDVELIVTTDVGPRVIRYGFAGGQNLFKEFEEQMGKSGETTWQPRGGHRIWMAPEDAVLSYALDNSPIKADVKTDGIVLTGNVEKETGLQKEMIIHLAASGTGVEVVNRLTNRGSQTRDMAAWALTMMAPGGISFFMFPPRGTHPKDLPPTNPLVMWAYTDFSDPRWHFTKRFLTLRMDPSATSPQKVGSFNRDLAAFYLLGSDLFEKRASASDPRKQPDFGCNYETFTSNQFLEMETLSEITTVKPGASVEQHERWSLHKNVKIAAWTEEGISRVVEPLLKNR